MKGRKALRVFRPGGGVARSGPGKAERVEGGTGPRGGEPRGGPFRPEEGGTCQKRKSVLL